MTARRIRTTALVRLGWAAGLLVVPARWVPGGPPVAAAARVLAVRHVAQAATAWLAPTGATAGLGAVVDTLHTGSCLALALVTPRWRSAALLDAAVEAGFAAAGWASADRRR